MVTRGEHSIRFKPRSVVDAVIGDNAQPGGCTSLSNLLFDQSTRNVLTCRPANIKGIDFSTWDAAPGNLGPVTVAYQVNGIIYGLIGITSGIYAGLDYPFAYNYLLSTFLTVSGITKAECPTSQSTSGAWTPPQMTATGVDLVTTHIGFDGPNAGNSSGNYFGWFNITAPTAPIWNAGNTGGNALPTVPQACQSFNNRTYLFCGNVGYYTDTLAINMTASNQSLNIGDITAVTAAAPLPTSTVAFGIAQGILVYKATQIYLITGDTITQNLALNQISISVGTTAPRSVVSTPEGVRFMAGDGIRDINFLSVVSQPDDDLAIPFIYAVTPSRVAAAYSSNIYRICVENGNAVGSPVQDYWYDYRRRGWTGPHTFAYDFALGYNNDFLISNNILPGVLWYSYTVQGRNGAGNTFIENGVQLSWEYTPAPMTDLDNLYANCAYRTTLEIAIPAVGNTYNFTAQNESGTALATGSIMGANSQTIWGSFNWGAANWGVANSGLIPTAIPWNQNMVFNRLSITGVGQSSLGLKLGAYRVGYKRLNYVLQ